MSMWIQSDVQEQNLLSHTLMLGVRPQTRLKMELAPLEH